MVSRLLGPGNERMHAAVTMITTITLCACALVLAGAASGGKQVSVEFATACGAVSALAGWAYGKAKQVEVAAMTSPIGKDVVPGSAADAKGGDF